jgi:cytochrome P450
VNFDLTDSPVIDVARELPLQAICMLLGVPQEARSQLCDWIKHLPVSITAR